MRSMSSRELASAFIGDALVDPAVRLRWRDFFQFHARPTTRHPERRCTASPGRRDSLDSLMALSKSSSGNHLDQFPTAPFLFVGSGSPDDMWGLRGLEGSLTGTRQPTG